MIASFQRDQDSKLSSVTVRAGHQSYRVPGSDFAFVKYPLFDHITATTEHFKGTISVTLIVPYYERYNDAGKAEPKFAWITVLDMKSHRVQ